MRNFRIFLVVEGILIFMSLLTILHNKSFSVFFVIGFIFLYLGYRGLRKGHSSSFLMIIGSLVLLLTLVTNIFIWLAVIIAFLYFANEQKERMLTEKKICIIETIEPDKQTDNQFIPWFGNIDIGKETFQWDDINIVQVAGDTIIDLENTILPKDDNIVLIRKAFGKTRIIVPSNIGMKIEYATLTGSLKINQKTEPVVNGVLTRYDANYYENSKHIKIYVNSILGDVEVIRT